MKKVLIYLFLIFLCFSANRVFASSTVDINTAFLAQLDEIVHVGPTIAQRIIDGRPYNSVQDLSRVKGIGDGKYLQDIISQGWACVNCQTSSTAQDANQVQTTQTNDTQNPTSVTIYPSSVYINEILPNPQGADSDDEWIELYNSNGSDVDLSGWQLQDAAGTTATFTIPQNTKVLANGFLVFKRPDTKIMLNNDQDGLNLLTPDKKIIDSVTFTSAPLNQSYNKIPMAKPSRILDEVGTNSGLPAQAGWQWSSTLTPGAKNIITAVGNKTPSTGHSTLRVSDSMSSGPNGLSKAKNSVKNDGVELGLADLNQSVGTNQTSSPWFLFFIALAITLILASIVLLVKFRVYNDKRETQH